jgi:hypothetical protein
MANPEHLEKLKEGVEAWNRWREDRSVVPDLKQAQLNGLDLSGVNLSRARLNGTNLRGTNLSRARLHKAELVRTFLRGANLQYARLFQTRFSNAELDDSDMTGAAVGGTVFQQTDLSRVRGLDALRHSGPSTVGLDTILRSGGKIPEPFLRGIGAPDSFISYVKSIAAHPVEFYSCFISYSTKDQEFADRLYADLQNKGVRCWFAPHDIQGGRKLHDQIDEAIRVHDKLLLILSPHSMESEWVKTEIAKARKREVRDKRRVLFPIRLAPFETLRDWECFDADTGKDSAREIREYFIPDFSNWKNHDSYVEAFTRLLKDLKAQEPATIVQP